MPMKTQIKTFDDVMRIHKNPDVFVGNEVDNAVQEEHTKSTGNKKKFIAFFKKDFVKRIRMQLREAKMEMNKAHDSTDVMDEQVTMAEEEVTLTQEQSESQ